MSTEDFSWHAIAVGNSVLGVYNFVVLAAPPHWKVVVMPMASDVFSHVSRDGAKWVRDGEVKHFVKAGSKFYELEIKVRPGDKTGREGAPVDFGGHRGLYRVSREGFLKKSDVLTVEVYCPETDRTISVRLKGDGAPLEILSYLRHSRCH
ncbi:MAG: hypothetical protein RXO32_04190 [Thermoproteus sp.]|jgi:hypothetical protein